MVPLRGWPKACLKVALMARRTVFRKAGPTVLLMGELKADQKGSSRALQLAC